MATIGPYLLFIVATALICVGLIYAAVESFRYELMAKGRLLLVILALLGILALVAFYFRYALGLSVQVPNENSAVEMYGPED